jgi:hypothetical protein
VFRCDRGDYRVLTTIAHGLRVHRAPGIPHALCFPGRKIFASLGRVAPRDREAAFTLDVIARQKREARLRTK